MQIINIFEESAPCAGCGQELTVLGNFNFKGHAESPATRKDELCACKNCGTEFIIRYEFFDKDGHVNSFVFNGDINDASYDWQKQLTDAQIRKIADHIRNCKICSDRLTEEMLSDAWMASILRRKK